jgi:hypothetical protein
MSSFTKLLEGQSYDGSKFVVNLTKLDKTIQYFTKFPLKTKKSKDFELWLVVRDLVLAKKHRTPEGLRQIINLKSQINADFKNGRGIV